MVDFAVTTDHKLKMKKKKAKREIITYTLHVKLKNLWNMKVTVIPVVIGELGTVT